jgi:hypothetical protein
MSVFDRVDRELAARARFVAARSSEHGAFWATGYEDGDRFLFAGEVAGIGIFVRNSGHPAEETVDLWKDHRCLSLTGPEARALAAVLGGPRT